MRRLALLLATAVGAGLVATSVLAASGPPPLTPDDPGWPGQWALRLVGIPEIWQDTSPDARPLIASVDTGIDPSFPDLTGQLVPGWNLVDGSADTSDTAGHGTDVAIVIAANANNGYGIAGACPMCQVMPVKISDDGTATSKLIAAGIRWAVDHGARIVTISMVHTGAIDTTEQAAVDYATSKGAVVISSAGNDAGTVPHYPAALPGVVSVTATDQSDHVYSWATSGNWVDLAAPGCEYASELCGASYAPPLVAAAIGVLMAAGTNVTPVQAIDALRATAVPVAGIDGGRIDVAAAARALGITGPRTGTTAGQVAGYTRQVSLERGRFGRILKETLVVGPGPLTVILTRVHARACTMSLRSKSTAYFSWRSTMSQLDISTSLNGGSYVLRVACADARRQPYSLLVSGLLPGP